jgi:hypothetical protein
MLQTFKRKKQINKERIKRKSKKKEKEKKKKERKRKEELITNIRTVYKRNEA